MTSAEAYLFDLDGVLRIRDLHRVGALESRHGLAPGTLEALAFAPERYGPAVLGEISDEEWRMSVVVALLPVVGDSGRAVECVLDWAGDFGHVHPDVRDVVDELRRAGCQVALLANGTTALEAELVALGLDAAVDAIVNSARHGVAMPDAGIYELAAGFLGVDARSCLYVGGRAEFVAGAERTGMAGHLYDGVPGLRAKVL